MSEHLIIAKTKDIVKSNLKLFENDECKKFDDNVFWCERSLLLNELRDLQVTVQFYQDDIPDGDQFEDIRLRFNTILRIVTKLERTIARDI